MTRNIVFKPILTLLMAFFTLLGATPAFASSMPNVSHINGVSGDFEREPSVTMNGTVVGAQRYIAVIDGIGYEAYCADPGKRGPESAGAVYELVEEAHPQLRNALVNGYPINTEWSGGDDAEDKMWWAYVTRVAVAMANHPTRTFAGEAAAVEQARSLANGSYTANHADYPPIMLNGEADAADMGRTINTATARSETFEVTHNRKTNSYHNPFRFEWAQGTPAGAELVANGTVIAVAPVNPSAIYRDDITSFHIETPNTAANRGKIAAVNLVGIHNQFADKIWMMQNPNDPDGWQNIVFYIAPVVASAAFSFTAAPDTPDPEPEPTPTPEPKPSNVKIQKIDALSRENIPGALMRLRGMTAMTLVTGDGQSFTVNNTGINLSQVLTAGAETALGDEIISTVSDGVWSIEGLPYGFYMVEEERAPENYSLLPQHTAYGFWVVPPDVAITAEGIPVINTDSEIISGDGFYHSVYVESVDHIDIEYELIFSDNPTSVLVTFENYPFGRIEVAKFDEVTGLALPSTHFRIQGYFAEGNTNGMPIDRVQITDNNGRTVFENLPAGQYTVSEAEAPPGYQFDSTEFRSISLTWGQTASATFYNKPKTFVEVIKVDGDTGVLLNDAIFRLSDPTSGEIWEGTTSGGRVRLGEGGGSFGNQLIEGKLYILTEIQAPSGYVLDPSPIEVIVAADNQLNTVTVRNFRKPTLTVIKYDELTNEPLAGATFRIWRTEGETWSETQITNANGRIVWTDLDTGIYSVQEIDEPYGYFRDPARKEILLEGGDNKQIAFFNRPRPTLTIFKRDLVTGEPLAGVRFRVQRLEGGTVGEFLTDENGMIELSPRTGYLLGEQVYRVTELQPPAEYLLGEQNVRDVLLKWYEQTELVFENLLKPTLIFTKTNALTGRGISGATYRVQYEAPNGGIVNLGNYVTKCGLIVLPHVQPGWYIMTEIMPAPGFSLPSNPVQRVFLVPGENSYAHAQTQVNLYVDPRTNPASGSRGMCGDCCGYLCSRLCGNNCGNPGDGGMATEDGGLFGKLNITNGNGEPIGTATPPSNPSTNPSEPPSNPAGNTEAEPPDFSNIVITGGTVVYLNPAFAGITITFGNQ